jgi:phosphoesterase RecJ-like protein
MMTRSDCARWLESHDNYCILTHRRPDGDTLGSAAALCLGLRQLGKRAWVLENSEATDRFAFLLEGLTVTEAGEHDTLVSVDVAAPGMLPRAFEPLTERVALRIDHHGSATSFTPLELVDPASASCAELVWDVLVEMGVKLDKALAEAIYVGISTDTGCFRFSNTTGHTFAAAAACAEAGGDIYRLNQEIFETNTLSRLRMQSWIVENLKLFGDGKFAIVAIPRVVEDLIGVTEDDMDNISNFPRTVAGVCMAATLRQTKGGDTKVSLRAVPGWDATEVCRHLGGGGHKGAAGATTPMSLAETAKVLEDLMLKL